MTNSIKLGNGVTSAACFDKTTVTYKQKTFFKKKFFFFFGDWLTQFCFLFFVIYSNNHFWQMALIDKNFNLSRITLVLLWQVKELGCITMCETFIRYLLQRWQRTLFLSIKNSSYLSLKLLTALQMHTTMKKSIFPLFWFASLWTIKDCHTHLSL